MGDYGAVWFYLEPGLSGKQRGAVLTRVLRAAGGSKALLCHPFSTNEAQARLAKVELRPPFNFDAFDRAVRAVREVEGVEEIHESCIRIRPMEFPTPQ